RLLPQTHLVGVERPKPRFAGVRKSRDHMSEIFRARAAASPMIADDRFDREFPGHGLFNEREFGRGVGLEPVYGDGDRQSELAQVGDMASEVREAGFERGLILRAK